MFYCGIDIAKNNHEASIIDEKCRLLIESISFSNSQKGCEKLFEKFEIIPENIVIGMEATGHYWLSVYSFLVENNFNVKVINPIQSEAVHNIIALRQLSRYRLALVDSCSDCKRRVIALLEQVLPVYQKFFSDVFGASLKELLLEPI